MKKLLLGFVLFLISFTSFAAPVDVNLSWTNPTQFSDGTALLESYIDKYEILYSIDDGVETLITVTGGAKTAYSFNIDLPINATPYVISVSLRVVVLPNSIPNQMGDYSPYAVSRVTKNIYGVAEPSAPINLQILLNCTSDPAGNVSCVVVP